MMRIAFIGLLSLASIACWTWLAWGGDHFAIAGLAVISLLELVGMLSFMKLNRRSLAGWNRALNGWKEEQQTIKRYLNAGQN